MVTDKDTEKFAGRNKALIGAYRKGASARRNGIPQSQNPYSDIRKEYGKLTWSRAFLRAWQDGWEE